MKHTEIIFAVVLTLVTPSLFAQASARPSDVVGLALVGHQVADLERSIKFFEAIDFKVVEGPGAWTVDKELNKLGNTPGAESRTATMRVQSSVSDVPFTLVLRQYRGMRQDWSKLNSWDLLASHIDLTVDGSVSVLLDKLEGLNMLKMPEVQGLLTVFGSDHCVCNRLYDHFSDNIFLVDFPSQDAMFSARISSSYHR